MKQELIKKPTIIICSLGRTGTRFFASFFSSLYEGAVCRHEPTSSHKKSYSLSEVVKTVIYNVRTFGVVNVFIKKIFGRWGVFNISYRRMAGEITDEKAIALLRYERQKFIDGFREPLYIESSYHYLGLLDLLPAVFKEARTVYIIRDPRDWVRSFINWRGLYSHWDIHYLLGNRLTPLRTGDEASARVWRKMDQFEKLAWAWNATNTHVLKTIKNNPNARLFYFEELFKKENREEKVHELINFLTDFSDYEVVQPKDLNKLVNGLLARKVNKPKDYSFPRWPEWDDEKAKILDKYCGELMRTLGYGQEREWKEKLAE